MTLDINLFNDDDGVAKDLSFFLSNIKNFNLINKKFSNIKNNKTKNNFLVFNDNISDAKIKKIIKSNDLFDYKKTLFFLSFRTSLGNYIKNLNFIK